MVRCSMLLLLGSLAVGCGGDDGGPGPLPDGDPFDPATLAPLYAAAVCDYRATCEPVFLEFLPQTQAQCVAEVTAQVRTSYDALAPLVGAPRIAFSRAGFDRCLAGYRDALADCELGVDPEACEDIFAGVTPLGEDCSTTEECAPGGACVGEGTAVCKTCRAVAALGEDCSSTTCGSGARCLDVGTGPKCIAANAPVGAACGTVETGLCAGRLQCVGSTTFTCQRPAQLGQLCDPSGTTGPDCNLYRGLACDDTDRCVRLTIGTDGTACGNGAPTLCRSDLYCDTASSRCQPSPREGQGCTFANCAEGFFCDSGTCRATRASGAACTASSQCSGDDVCQDDACGPLHFSATCGD